MTLICGQGTRQAISSVGGRRLAPRDERAAERQGGELQVLQAPVARRASPQVLQARCGAITLFKVGALNAFAWRDLHVAHALTV